MHFHVKAAGGLEQGQQKAAKGNILERPVKNRLRYRANRRFKFINPSFRRHPAGFNVQFRHPPVIAVEKRQKILGQIVLVGRTQRPDNAKVHGDIAGILGIFGVDEDIAGMHVGVKKTVAEHLGEKDHYAPFRQFLHVHSTPPQFGNVPYRNAINSLHD